MASVLKIRVSVVRFRPWPPSNSASYASSTPCTSDVLVPSDHFVTIATRIAFDAGWVSRPVNADAWHQEEAFDRARID